MLFFALVLAAITVQTPVHVSLTIPQRCEIAAPSSLPSDPAQLLSNCGTASLSAAPRLTLEPSGTNGVYLATLNF